MNQAKDYKAVFKRWLVSLIIGVMLLFLCSYLCIFYLLTDTFGYRDTVHLTSREEVFEMVLEHQDELDQMIADMEAAGWEEGLGIEVIDRNTEEKEGLQSTLAFIKDYSIAKIYIYPKWTDDHTMDGFEQVKFSLAFATGSSFSASTYTSFYYSGDGEPDVPSYTKEMTKAGDVYLISGHRFRYETEHIAGNWYYCREYAW